jgi:hypothetical protein
MRIKIPKTIHEPDQKKIREIVRKKKKNHGQETNLPRRRQTHELETPEMRRNHEKAGPMADPIIR